MESRGLKIMQMALKKENITAASMEGCAPNEKEVPPEICANPESRKKCSVAEIAPSTSAYSDRENACENILDNVPRTINSDGQSECKYNTADNILSATNSGKFDYNFLKQQRSLTSDGLSIVVL